MKRSRLWASLLGIVIVSASLLVLNLALGNTPVLGLDLRGGVSVILASTEGAGDEDLIVIRDLIRDELEQRGIAEPDVRVEGSNVIVDLPGVKDQQDALDAVDIAGIVSLRPVIQCAVTDDTSTTVGEAELRPRNVHDARRHDPGEQSSLRLRPPCRRPPTPRPPRHPPGSAGGSPTDAPSTTAAPTATTAVPGSDLPTTTAAAPTATTVPIGDPNDPAAPGQQEVAAGAR